MPFSIYIRDANHPSTLDRMQTQREVARTLGCERHNWFTPRDTGRVYIHWWDGACLCELFGMYGETM